MGENADEFMKGWMSRNRGMTGVSGARWEVFDPLLLGEEGVAMITEVFEVDDTHELTGYDGVWDSFRGDARPAVFHGE